MAQVEIAAAPEMFLPPGGAALEWLFSDTGDVLFNRQKQANFHFSDSIIRPAGAPVSIISATDKLVRRSEKEKQA